jgi:hypothetical protein
MKMYLRGSAKVLYYEVDRVLDCCIALGSNTAEKGLDCAKI